MPLRQPGWNQTRAEQLMEIAILLGEFTQSPERLKEIPHCLVERLNVARVTLALAHDTPVGPELMLNLSADQAGDTTPSKPEELLTLYFRTRPVSESHGPVFRPAGDASEQPMPGVLLRQLDAGFRMLLVFHPRPEQSPLTSDDEETLEAVARTLSLLMESAALWIFRPDALGTPFKSLTQREWTVLRELQTGIGEKQLAPRLQMSPHTLHSHVKAIYRKVGVPGRLPLMLKVQELMREMRLSKVRKTQGVDSQKAQTERSAVSV